MSPKTLLRQYTKTFLRYLEDVSKISKRGLFCKSNQSTWLKHCLKNLLQLSGICLREDFHDTVKLASPFHLIEDISSFIENWKCINYKSLYKSTLLLRSKKTFHRSLVRWHFSASSPKLRISSKTNILSVYYLRDRLWLCWRLTERHIWVIK